MSDCVLRWFERESLNPTAKGDHAKKRRVTFAMALRQIKRYADQPERSKYCPALKRLSKKHSNSLMQGVFFGRGDKSFFIYRQ